ncbi:hypothetical protein AMK59_1749, partial [Oryctes borbonicus]
RVNSISEEDSSLPELKAPEQSKCNSTEKMALVPAGETTLKEEEIEQTIETTLAQKSQDLGHTQTLEKSAEFRGQQTTKVVEETGSSESNLECAAKDQSENIPPQPQPQTQEQPPMEQKLPDIYKPLEPIKKLEPLQPFAPLNQLESPKSFQLAKQIEADIQTTDTLKQDLITPEVKINSVQRPNPTVQNGISNAIVDGQIDDDSSFPTIKPLELQENPIKVKQYEPLRPFDIEQFNENPTDDKRNISVQNTAPVIDVTNMENTNGEVETTSELSSNTLPEDFPLREPSEMRTSTGELYVPVVALEPLNLDDFLKPITVDTSQKSAEIKQDKIKQSLKEIISDLDTYAEKDKELKETLTQDEELKKLINSDENKENLERQRQIAQELNKVIQSNGTEQV